MDLSHVLILSVVEGVTEFIPVSSTAHLVLTSHALNIPASAFLSTFEISIQLGAIGAVCVVSGRKILSDKKLLYKALVGFVPTGILGFTLFKYIKPLLSDPFIPVTALFLGGLTIIGLELYFKSKLKSENQKLKTLDKMTYKDSLIIGLIQSISMIPGVSRSAASIFGGMALKLDRKSATEYSFLLAIPTMVAATMLSLLSDTPSFSQQELTYFFLGIAGSFISALLVIKWLMGYVKKNNFILFGIYRILIAIVYFFIFLR